MYAIRSYYEIVKAYVQLDPAFRYDGDEKALKEDITRFAKEMCSPYEVPKLIEIINEIPLTRITSYNVCYTKLLRVACWNLNLGSCGLRAVGCGLRVTDCWLRVMVTG